MIHLSAEFIQKHTQTTKLKIQFIRFELNQINCFVQNFLMETSLFLLLWHVNHFSKLFCSNIVRTKLAYMWTFSRENRRKFVIKNHVTRSHLSHSYINIGNYRLISHEVLRLERTSFGAKVLNLIKSNKTSEYMISINNRRDEIIKLNCSLLNFPFF